MNDSLGSQFLDTGASINLLGSHIPVIQATIALCLPHKTRDEEK